MSPRRNSKCTENICLRCTITCGCHWRAEESLRGGMSSLLTFQTKQIDDPAVVETVWTTTVSGIPEVSLNRYNQDNWRNLKKNKLPLFTRHKRPTASKGKEAFIKNDLICKTLHRFSEPRQKPGWVFPSGK